MQNPPYYFNGTGGFLGAVHKNQKAIWIILRDSLQ